MCLLWYQPKILQMVGFCLSIFFRKVCHTLQYKPVLYHPVIFTNKVHLSISKFEHFFNLMLNRFLSRGRFFLCPTANMSFFLKCTVLHYILIGTKTFVLVQELANPTTEAPDKGYIGKYSLGL